LGVTDVVADFDGCCHPGDDIVAYSLVVRLTEHFDGWGFPLMPELSHGNL
jgi:hypothetical protein